MNKAPSLNAGSMLEYTVCDAVPALLQHRVSVPWLCKTQTSPTQVRIKRGSMFVRQNPRASWPRGNKTLELKHLGLTIPPVIALHCIVDHMQRYAGNKWSTMLGYKRVDQFHANTISRARKHCMQSMLGTATPCHIPTQQHEALTMFAGHRS